MALALVGSALTLAACSSGSSPSSTPSSTAHPGVAVLGAPTAVWQSAHPANSVGGTSGYGSTVTVDGHSVPQFTGLESKGGRVIGFHMSFPPSTHLSAAEGLVRAQLPKDVEQTASWRGSFGRAGAYCEFVNYQSKTLAAALGTTSSSSSGSNIGVKLFEIENGKSGSPTIRVVNSADVSTTPGVQGQAC